MKIEVFNSVAGASFFQGLLAEWRKQGHEVVCHEALSEAEYRKRRGRLGRLWVRWKMYGAYGLRCWRLAARKDSQPCIRIVATNPFFAPALVARASAGRVPVVNLLYDLYPEALELSGVLRPGSWLSRRCAAITTRALKQCSATVFLGDFLRQFTESTHGFAQSSHVLPIGAQGEPYRNTPPSLGTSSGRVRILYSGQLGRMHDILTVQSHLLDQSRLAPVDWVFRASGAGYEKLKVSVPEVSGVAWGGPMPDSEWENEMKRAQVALVTMVPGAERVVMPSKTYSALVAGQAVLAVCPANSDLATLVRKHDCGWVVQPGDTAGFSRAIEEMTSAPAELLRRRQNAFEAGHAFYDVGPVSREWLRLLEDLVARGSKQGN